MTAFETSRIALATGVTLNVAQAGPEDAPAIIFLHGFPESHRTWRHVAPALADRYRVIAPDQRGFGASDQPEGVDNYRAAETIADLVALADALGIGRFTLVGHDWGGAIAWGAALTRPGRLDRLVIVNAPHPHIFQNSLIDDPAQRAASQYITAFRRPAMERGIAAMGIDTFFAKSFGGHTDLAAIPAEERQAYLDDWSRPGAMTAMLNWYRASPLIVPAIGEEAPPLPRRADPFPIITTPTLVLWGMKDKALLPVQLDGLESLVAQLTVTRIHDAGHFVPWEQPGPVIAAIGAFMETPAAPSR